MTGALDQINRLVVTRCVVFTRHARERMLERSATVDDVYEALLSATSATWQEARQNWLVAGGVDLDGERLRLIVDIEADVIVVTL